MKKFLIFFLLAFVIIHPNCFAQKSTLLFSDDFENNKNGWYLRNDSSFKVDIQNGKLHIEKYIKNFTDRGCLWMRKEIPGFNTLEDFSITVYARNIYGDDVFNSFDIQWGVLDKRMSSKITSIYQLNYLYERGDVQLDYFNNGWDYSLRKEAKEIAQKNMYKPGAINKYEIIQQDGFVILKINDQQYFKQYAKPVAGNSIGFQRCLKSAWEIDKIMIHQLAKTNNIVLADTAASAQPLAATQFKNNATGDIQIAAFPNPFTEQLNVQFLVENNGMVVIDLYNINGVSVLQYKKSYTAGMQNVQLYADVPAGTYILKVTAANKSGTVKLVKIQ